MADFSIDALGQLAASGTASTTIAVPQGTQVLEVQVGAEYATNDATGVSVALQTSVDGTTFVSAKETMENVNPAAATVGSNKAVIRLGNDPFAQDPKFLNSIKVSVTNTSSTTPANYTVGHRAEPHIL